MFLLSKFAGGNHIAVVHDCAAEFKHVDRAHRGDSQLRDHGDSPGSLTLCEGGADQGQRHKPSGRKRELDRQVRDHRNSPGNSKLDGHEEAAVTIPILAPPALLACVMATITAITATRMHGQRHNDVRAHTHSSNLGCILHLNVAWFRIHATQIHQTHFFCNI